MINQTTARQSVPYTIGKYTPLCNHFQTFPQKIQKIPFSPTNIFDFVFCILLFCILYFAFCIFITNFASPFIISDSYIQCNSKTLT